MHRRTGVAAALTTILRRGGCLLGSLTIRETPVGHLDVTIGPICQTGSCFPYIKPWNNRRDTQSGSLQDQVRRFQQIYKHKNRQLRSYQQDTDARDSSAASNLLQDSPLQESQEARRKVIAGSEWWEEHTEPWASTAPATAPRLLRCCHSSCLFDLSTGAVP